MSGTPERVRSDLNESWAIFDSLEIGQVRNDFCFAIFINYSTCLIQPWEEISFFIIAGGLQAAEMHRHI